jgi:7-carboxy-7-deazaguanine synthase (Cx14CxxC type)
MTYSVKELFKTLQGEGAQAGRAAVFCRFAGCNLWSGRESDRAQAVCTFCDTDFVGTDGEGGGKFADAQALAAAIAACWGGGAENRYVVFTGGEPLLQLDDALVAAVHAQGFAIAIETNGTLAPPAGIDWICVSPKGTSQVVVTRGNELKLVYPQLEALPERYAHLDFEHFFLQPMDGPGETSRAANTERIVRYCMQHPQWRLSLQTHKYIGIP